MKREKRGKEKEKEFSLSSSHSSSLRAAIGEGRAFSFLFHPPAPLRLFSVPTFPFRNGVHDEASDCSATLVGRRTPVKRGERREGQKEGRSLQSLSFAAAAPPSFISLDLLFFLFATSSKKNKGMWFSGASPPTANAPAARQTPRLTLEAALERASKTRDSPEDEEAAVGALLDAEGCLAAARTAALISGSSSSAVGSSSSSSSASPGARVVAALCRRPEALVRLGPCAAHRMSYQALQRRLAQGGRT